MMTLFPLARRAAFSLMEMLVAVAIIVVLAAFAFPVMGRMRENAQRVGCVSNLKTIGGAITAYAFEHQGRLPGPSFAMVELAKAHAITGKMKDYLDPATSESVWECPANPALKKRNEEARRLKTTRYAAYTTRTPVFGYTYTPPKPSPEPMQLADVRQQKKPDEWILRDVDYWSYPDVNRVGGNYPPVHNGGRNHLYGDMSVEWRAVPTP